MTPSDSAEMPSLAGRFMGMMGLSRQNSEASSAPVIETISYENHLAEIHEDSPTVSSFDNPSPLHSPKKLSLNTTVQKTKIAWAFAQMTGQFTIDDNYIKGDSLNAASEKILYDTPGQKRRTSVGTPKGGGSLSATVQHHEKSQKALHNALPLFNTPPTILFSDLQLETGEEITFKYELLLPASLPPSHRGTRFLTVRKACKISVQTDYWHPKRYF
jgi:Rgp1